MNRVSGIILEGLNRKGLENVHVVLYDLDIDLKQKKQASKKQASNVYEYYLSLIYGGVDTEEDKDIPFQARADRLGSVITDSVGQFLIEFDDEAFRINDNEARPDLLLLVVAPDRPIGGKLEEQLPLGTPEINRILHMGFFPVRNMGRNEQFIIHVSQKALEKQGLTSDTTTTPLSFASAVVAPSARRTNVRNTLRKVAAVGQKVSKSRKLEKEAELFTANLSALPLAFREDTFFVNGSNSTKDIIDAARSAGISKLAGHVSALLHEPAAKLTLDEKTLGYLGVFDITGGIDFAGFKERLERGEQIEVEIDTKKFCATVQEQIGGVALERISGLLSNNQRQQSERLENLCKDVPVLPDPEVDLPDAEVISAEQEIKNLVMKEVALLRISTPEPSEQEQVAKVLENLQKLKPPASPADVTQFHDFTNLQVAFPDVWAEAFDSGIESILRRMHIEYQELDEDYKGDDATSIFGESGIDPSELDDLNDYTDLMRKLGADIMAVGTASEPPREVSLFFAKRLERPRNNESDSGTAIVRVRRVGNALNYIFFQQKVADLIEAWPLLSIEQQEELIELASMPDNENRVRIMPRSGSSERSTGLLQTIMNKFDSTSVVAGVQLYRELKEEENDLTTESETFSREERLERADAIVANPAGRISRVQRLLAGLAERISEPHSFQIFQKNSINFGILTTYRQEWVPEDYQVGSLVSTLPLAPSETRKYTTKYNQKKTRSQKENEKFASTVKDERIITSRAVSDILEKSNTTTNFQQAIGSQAGGKIFGFNVNVTSNTQFQRNQAVESQRVKKDFREAVRKASQEYKNERSVELSTENIDEFESTSATEINNPNNEITVTYLFYELERQYRVSERLHRLTPIVLVAQEIPSPADIDEDWLQAHEWILRRSLLDYSFNEALDYISDGLIADEVTLETRRDAYETQKTLVEELTDTVVSLSTMQNTLRDTLIQTSEQESLARVARKRAKKRRRLGRLKKAFLPTPGISGKIARGSSSLAFGSNLDDPEALEARREALETRLGFLEGNLEDSRARLTRANSSLEQATDSLVQAVEEDFTKRSLVSQLRIHVKSNILHYMQAIWSYEQPDQRFFRLYGLKVDVPVNEDIATFEAIPVVKPYPPPPDVGTDRDTIRVGLKMPPPNGSLEQRRLHEIADLDQLLGFKGNYMMFPLKECTYLTDYMMQDYVDDYLGINDPDVTGNYSTEELLQHAEDIWKLQSTTDGDREALGALIKKRLSSSKLEDELIVVSTGQLFIEALKGEHALLEDFKHKHRGLDVLKVQEEVQAARLENLRRAARLVGDEPLLDDPDVDKNIVVSGTNVDVEVS